MGIGPIAVAVVAVAVIVVVANGAQERR